MWSEPYIRFAFFIGVFGVIALWEALAPRRRLNVPRVARWPANLGIVLLNTALVRLCLPVTAVGFATLCEQRGWGLLGLFDLPRWLAAALAILALDLAIYLQHVLFHAVPALWRLHRMHHADLDIDVTTGTRFHPLEIALSMMIKLAAIAALGAPATAVLVFEILLSATAMFNHGNIRMPVAIDRLLRWVVVTPDMHRIHHSILPYETNSNFGFNMPWWDRLFGTYRAMPAGEHATMTIGVTGFLSPSERRFDRLLTQPFREGADEPLAPDRAPS